MLNKYLASRTYRDPKQFKTNMQLFFHLLPYDIDQ